MPFIVIYRIPNRGVLYYRKYLFTSYSFAVLQHHQHFTALARGLTTQNTIQAQLQV